MIVDPRFTVSLVAAVLFAATGLSSPASAAETPAASVPPVVAEATAAPTLAVELPAEEAFAADLRSTPKVTRAAPVRKKVVRRAVPVRRYAAPLPRVRVALRSDVPPSFARSFALLGVGFGF